MLFLNIVFEQSSHAKSLDGTDEREKYKPGFLWRGTDIGAFRGLSIVQTVWAALYSVQDWMTKDG